MIKRSTLSRRKAASLVGTAIVALGSSLPARAGGVAVTARVEPDLDRLVVRGRRELLAALGSVRRATGPEARALAFEHFKKALAINEYAEHLPRAGSLDPKIAPDKLYRGEDPARVLARVLVRELDISPKAGAGWLHRFGELERLLRERTASASHYV